MEKKRALLVAGILVMIALLAAFLLIRSPVKISVNGQIRTLDTAAFTSGAALQEAGIRLNQNDKVLPGMNDWIGSEGRIIVMTALPVTVWIEGIGAGETFYSTERTPIALLSQAGISIASGDQLLLNGMPVQPDQDLPEAAQIVLQIRKNKTFQLNHNGLEKTLHSNRTNLGAALWQGGIQVGLADLLSQAYLVPIEDGVKINLSSARLVKITADGKTIEARSAAQSVGQALKEAGIPLQGHDYSLPPETQPIPVAGTIQVVRVREEVELKQTFIPYKSELVADPTLELDQRRIVQAGQEGIKVTRVLVRYENNKEVKRTTEAEWTAAEPVIQKTGYGTKIVIRTMDTPDGPIQYWRSARVWATSMYPCGFIPFIGQCSYTTANGSTLQKGVIGMGETWYRLMVNQGVYVEGYGKAIVADYGYVGGYWVDLGYSDADYVPWHQYTTLYWLTPVPSNIPWILPP